MRLSNYINNLSEDKISDFFYKYKSITKSTGGLLAMGKTKDKIAEENHVLIYFRKRHQSLKKMEEHIKKKNRTIFKSLNSFTTNMD